MVTFEPGTRAMLDNRAVTMMELDGEEVRVIWTAGRGFDEARVPLAALRPMPAVTRAASGSSWTDAWSGRSSRRRR